jgi:RecB family exonuclease
MGVALDLDFVVVLGLAEGTFPAPSMDDALLTDEERIVVGDELGLRAEEVERQHHDLLATLAGASRHALIVPRGDLRRTSEHVPSRWVLDVAKALRGSPCSGEELLAGRAQWLSHVASHDAGLRRVEFPADEQEYRLRALLAHGSRIAVDADGVPDRIMAAGAAVVASRRSTQFTRFDGNLVGADVPSPVERATSATRLEGWAKCPFAYFMREILGVDEVENPEDRLQISPLDLGSLVHEVLERFIDGVLGRPAHAQPRPTDPWSASDRAELHEIAEAVCSHYEEHGFTGRPLFWRRDKRRLLGDLDEFLRADSEHRAVHGTRPLAAELAFGLPGAALGTVPLVLPDGRSVSFRGKADRLDIATDGTVEVIDYKTGRAEQYAQLSEDNPDGQGTKLQLTIYGLAARLHQGSTDVPVRAEYWFTSGKGGFRRIGYRLTAEVLERVRATVGQMVGGIERGVFPSYPTATSTSPFVECAYCDPDGLGVIDLRRQVERKRSDAALTMFFDLHDLGEVDGD